MKVSSLNCEPMGFKILNELAEFAIRNEKCTGQLTHMLADGRLLVIRIDQSAKKTHTENSDATV